MPPSHDIDDSNFARDSIPTVCSERNSQVAQALSFNFLDFKSDCWEKPLFRFDLRPLYFLLSKTKCWSQKTRIFLTSYRPLTDNYRRNVIIRRRKTSPKNQKRETIEKSNNKINITIIMPFSPNATTQPIQPPRRTHCHFDLTTQTHTHTHTGLWYEPTAFNYKYQLNLLPMNISFFRFHSVWLFSHFTVCQCRCSPTYTSPSNAREQREHTCIHIRYVTRFRSSTYRIRNVITYLELVSQS